MTCSACKARGQTWAGDPPVCAFPNGGRFVAENWNCATAGIIRDIAYEGQETMPRRVDYRYCEDQKYATIQVDDIDGLGGALALWVSWYKSRGTTDAMWLLFADSEPVRPNEAQILEIARITESETRSQT